MVLALDFRFDDKSSPPDAWPGVNPTPFIRSEAYAIFLRELARFAIPAGIATGAPGISVAPASSETMRRGLVSKALSYRGLSQRALH